MDLKIFQDGLVVDIEIQSEFAPMDLIGPISRVVARHTFLKNYRISTFQRQLKIAQCLYNYPPLSLHHNAE